MNKEFDEFETRDLLIHAVLGCPAPAEQHTAFSENGTWTQSALEMVGNDVLMGLYQKHRRGITPAEEVAKNLA